MKRSFLYSVAISSLLGSLISSAVVAAPIADTVIVGDKEWAQVTLFTDLSWSNVNAVCPAGTCGIGTLNGWDMAGWSWATRSEVGDLLLAPFTTHPGGVARQTEGGNTVSAWMGITGFNTTGGPSGSSPAYVNGSTSDLGGGSSSRGRAIAFYNNIFSTYDTDVTVNEIFSDDYFGAWMYRAPVPLPPAILFLGSGIAALLFRRRVR